VTAIASAHPRGSVRARLARSGHQARARALELLARFRYRDPVGPRDRLASWLADAARMGTPELVESVVRANLEAHGAAALAAAGRAAMSLVSPVAARRTLFTAVWRAVKDSDDAALAFAEPLIDEFDRGGIAVAVARLLARRNAIERPLQLCLRYPDRAPDLLHRLRHQSDLLRDGCRLPPRAARTRRPGRRAIYYLSQSMPHLTSGYAIRSHWMLRHLRAAGWEATGVTRFGYPIDRADHAHSAATASQAEIDGVPYQFRPDPIGFRELDGDYIARAARALVAQAGELRPAILHAASNYQVGLAGIAAARALGLPSIYEVRGLWHLTRTSKEPDYDGSDHYRMVEGLEVQAAREADHTFVITEAVLELLAGHGVDRAKMSLLPNAVDLDAFAPRPRDAALADQLGVAGKVVIGTIGTFKWYEGLDLLLETAASLRRSLGDVFRILLVGDGPESQRLAELRARLGLEEVVVMTGRVSHDEVARHYSVIDIAVYPRTDARVCHFVSPLKPLEAMAMEKAVVVSGVRAQAEMIEDGVTGLIHQPGDGAALERALAALIADPVQRSELASSARAWVAQHRSWPAIASIVTRVYERLLA